MSDVAWCRATLNRLQGQLDNLAHRLRGYTRRLEDARLAWRDAAAQEVFDRYLDPHRISLEELCAHLSRQLAELRQCVGQMEAAGTPEQEVQRLSTESASLRERTRNDLAIAHLHADVALRAAADASHLAAQAGKILASIPKAWKAARG
jgi:hypothetical protein